MLPNFKLPNSRDCNDIAKKLGDASLTLCGISEPLSDWLKASSCFFKVVSAKLGGRKIYENSAGAKTFALTFKTLAAFSKLVPTSIVGTNFYQIFKKLKTIAVLADAAINFKQVTGNGSSRDKLMSLLRASLECLLILSQMWLTSIGVGTMGLPMLGIIKLTFVIINQNFLCLNSEYDFFRDAAEEIFSTIKIPNKLAKPLIDFYVNSKNS